MKKYKKILTASLIVTLPISIFFLILLYNTYTTYMAIDTLKQPIKKASVIPKGQRLDRIVKSELVQLLETIRTTLGIQPKSDVNIFIKSKDKKHLNSHLPQSGFKDKKSLLMLDEQILKGKIRYRGDNYYHWFFPHKSWRFKTSKNNLFNKTRKINFIIPKSDGLLGNHLSYKLARTLGLLAPESKMVSLNVNQKYNGVKLMVAQIDESFLRNNRRMPNDIYKGDNIGSLRYQGVRIPSVFDIAHIWDKAAINNHYAKDYRKPLEDLLVDLKEHNNTLLDTQSFAKNMALLDLTSSFHYDAQHNWILYYDNYYEKFYPIIWDTMGWQKAWTDKKSLNIIHTSKLFESLYSDYSFVKEKYYVLHKFLTFQKKDFISFMDKEIQTTLDKVNTAGYHYSTGGKILSPSTVQENMQDFKQRILDRFNLVSKTFYRDINVSEYKYTLINNKIRLSINGDKLINAIHIKLKNKIPIDDIYISYKKNELNVTHQVPYEISNDTIKINIDLLSKLDIKTGKPYPKSYYVNYTEAIYDIHIKGLSAENIEDVSLSYLSLHKNKFTISHVKTLDLQAFTQQQNIVLLHKNATVQNWSGSKYIQGNTLVYDDIIIAPGTQIIFDENATLKVLGKVKAIGTKENPIVFKAKNDTKPWNAFALKDSKADKSVFKYCIFKDGSGDKGDLHEYTAMFSVHNVKNLLIENCEFYDSHRTDDMVHVIYSDAVFKHTKFVRSLSDALDVDISTLLVDNCEFIDSGNDSIDLMTTNAVVINTKFTNSKDKGISIGEGSNLLAINNYIQGSEIGMQSKDTSKAYIYNTTFISNKKAIDAYHKNWRYSEGGSIYLDKCVFENNTYNATVGKKSKVIINNSKIDTINNFDTKSLKKNKIQVNKYTETIISLPMMDLTKYIYLINTAVGYHEN